MKGAQRRGLESWDSKNREVSFRLKVGNGQHSRQQQEKEGRCQLRATSGVVKGASKSPSTFQRKPCGSLVSSKPFVSPCPGTVAPGVVKQSLRGAGGSWPCRWSRRPAFKLAVNPWDVHGEVGTSA